MCLPHCRKHRRAEALILRCERAVLLVKSSGKHTPLRGRKPTVIDWPRSSPNHRSTSGCMRTTCQGVLAPTTLQTRLRLMPVMVRLIRDAAGLRLKAEQGGNTTFPVSCTSYSQPKRHKRLLSEVVFIVMHGLSPESQWGSCCHIGTQYIVLELYKLTLQKIIYIQYTIERLKNIK